MQHFDLVHSAAQREANVKKTSISSSVDNGLDNDKNNNNDGDDENNGTTKDINNNDDNYLTTKIQSLTTPSTSFKEIATQQSILSSTIPSSRGRSSSVPSKKIETL